MKNPSSTLSPELDLSTRSGLPDALLVRARQHPKTEWERLAALDPTTAFWLDRHALFRTLRAQLTAEAEAMLDTRIEPAAYAQRLHRLGGLFIGELHGHHQVEDLHYFPALAAMDDRLARGFEVLEADHGAIDGLLHQLTDEANGALAALSAADDARDAVGRVRDTLEVFARPLERHLADEEDLVIPLLLARDPHDLA